MLAPTPTPDPALASPASPSPADARAAAIKQQIRGLALVLFTWTARDPDLEHSTASERLLARAIRPWLPKLRDALLNRLEGIDPAALEAMIGATATALESMLYYAPGEALPRYVWTFREDGSVELQPRDGPAIDG